MSPSRDKNGVKPSDRGSMSRVTELFQLWKTDCFFDAQTRAELAELCDEKEIEDRFYKDLEFGTGGLRGVMGAGTNRMNVYTVGRATAGFAEYLLDRYGEEAKRRGVVIGYDTRLHSAEFARVTANILSGLGIRVYLSKLARPTPQLSFSVTYFHAIAGIVVTASHNPKQYNGYKVYDEFGCQLCPEQANGVIFFIHQITDYRSLSFEGKEALIEGVDTTQAFVQATLRQACPLSAEVKKQLKIVYTPLHGTGLVPVTEALARDGFTDVAVVAAQAVADGEFSTVVSPNPEDRRALERGIVQAIESGADIVLGTDPDCDRVGVAVREGEDFKLLTGNQTGALLADYLLSNTDLSAYRKPAVIKTIVTSELGASIAQKHGVTVFSTLTGFKFIGEKITQFEEAKRKGDRQRDYDFLFGYEESYGYLAGTHARDKDAVVSGLLICEMAGYYKALGKTLTERLAEIYQVYGFYLDALDCFTLCGKDGLERIDCIMKELRAERTPFLDVVERIDYSVAVDAEEGFGKLPTSNVLKYILSDGSWLAVRPSGTEPKIKIYYSVRAENEQSAQVRLDIIRATITKKMGV